MVGQIYLDGTEDRFDENEQKFNRYTRVVVLAEDREEAREVAKDIEHRLDNDGGPDG